MKYQAMLSIAGGPYEPVGLPTEDKAEAQIIAEMNALEWNCRTDWYIESPEDEEE